MLTSKDFALSRVAFVSQDALIQDAVKLMIERQISSVLVCNHRDEVVGILTERDVVRKVTLLDVQEKLTHTVSTVMSRPVQCVRLASLIDDVVDLHLKHKIRHFPVVDTAGVANRQTVVGIISVTDIARLVMHRRQAGGEDSASSQGGGRGSSAERRVAVLVHDEAGFELYRKLFGALDYQLTRVDDPLSFSFSSAAEPFDEEKMMPLIFDLDGWPAARLRELLPSVQQRFSPLLMATSDARLLSGLKQYLKDARQDVVIKPLDLSYCDWLLTQRFRA